MTAARPHAKSIRQQARMGVLRGHTSGLAGDHVQGNLVILPKAHADDFARFCELNPKPCPVLGMAAPGDFAFPDLGEDIDIRSDLPMYRVWRDGVMSEDTQKLVKEIASKIAEKWEKPNGVVTAWVRAKIALALIRSASACIRGARARKNEWAHLQQHGFEDGAGMEQHLTGSAIDLDSMQAAATGSLCSRKGKGTVQCSAKR